MINQTTNSKYQECAKMILEGDENLINALTELSLKKSFEGYENQVILSETLKSRATNMIHRVFVTPLYKSIESRRITVKSTLEL